MPFLGEGAALLTAVFWAASSSVFAAIGARAGAQVVNRGRLLISLMFLVGLHWLVEGTPWPLEVGQSRWLWLGVSSLLGLVIGDVLLFQAFASIGARLSMLVMATVPIQGALLSWALLGERLSGIQSAGVVLGSAGVLAVLLGRGGRPTHLDGRAYGVGLLFAFGGAIGQVANLLTARLALQDAYSALSATFIRTLIAVVILWVIAGLRGSIGRTIRGCLAPGIRGRLVLGSLVGPAVGIWLSMVAIQFAPIGVASTLMALPPVLLVLWEVGVRRKPLGPGAVLGTLIAFAGVGLIFLS